MATLVLGLAGQALGSSLLPAGVSVFGQVIAGATIGGAVGALAGATVDSLLRGSQRVQGPRLTDLYVQGSSEGAAIPRVWGAARLAGQVIWAARFNETSQESGGGKAGARVTTYRYTASFAVGLCEGVIGGLGRIWADGNLMAMDGVTMRLHRGDEGQGPDPLIETIEGVGHAPAYRGLAYVVFEDLPLEPYGNRVPQLSFEVMRPVSEANALADVVEAVCLIPGSGEFALAPETVLRFAGRGVWAAENRNNASGRSDFEASLDQMEAALPKVKRVALVVAWFGTDLRVGECEIRPGVEVADKHDIPAEWSVAGLSRGDAHLVSATDGRPNYGGTPSDDSVKAAIQLLKARGHEVMLYPFVLMDVTAGNDLPDPHGGTEQAAFPWRGRITGYPGPGQAGTVDKTAAAGSQVAAFFTRDWGLRTMVLHYASLAAEAGGVDAMLIGSELVGVTTLRDGPGSYPAVAQLQTLAGGVRAIVGPSCKISYGADWTEWRGHAPEDGGGDVFFHLDPLWADEAIDFIGIDNYAPLSDWRDGTGHADYALSATRSIYDQDYLKSRVEAGEAYDWFYASDADRAAQLRTPIADGAYGKPFVFRQKDARDWWSNAHYDRPGGVEAASSTAWVPQMKPIRFTEIGCPAVDKGANQPNVFFDPRSSESAYPHFSSGQRDDEMQRAALTAALGYWRQTGVNPVSSVYGGAMLDVGHAYVWAWDTRPFPDWPLRTDVWGDGALWRTGHWLNGRAGAAPLGALVAEICAYAGVAGADVSGLRGACGGYALDRVMSAREALQPLMDAYAFDVAESAGTLRFFHRGDGAATVLAAGDLAEPETGKSAAAVLTRSDTAALPAVAKAVYVDPLNDYQSASVERRLNAAPAAGLMQIELPLSLTRVEAEGIAARTLMEAWAAREAASFALPPSALALEPGDPVGLTVNGIAWEGRITRVSETGLRLVDAGTLVPQIYEAAAPVLEGAAGDAPPVFGPAIAVPLDVAPAALGSSVDGLALAVFAAPWPGSEVVLRAAEVDGTFGAIARPTRRAVIGETTSVLPRGAPNRWDRVNTPEVLLYGGVLTAATERQVLDGANRAAVETAPGMFEIIQFAGAELIASNTWRLSTLLRGQFGSEAAIVDALVSGARFVLLDGSLRALPIGPDQAGNDVFLRFGPAIVGLDDIAFAAQTVGYLALGRRPWAVCRVRALRSPGGDLVIGWIRRARDDAGFWTEREVALGEESELYRLEILDGASTVRSVTVRRRASPMRAPIRWLIGAGRYSIRSMCGSRSFHHSLAMVCRLRSRCRFEAESLAVWLSGMDSRLGGSSDQVRGRPHRG